MQGYLDHMFAKRCHCPHRERCLDVTLDLLAYERQLHPGVVQNLFVGETSSIHTVMAPFSRLHQA